MDAPCEIQGSIHVFRLVNNMCPGKWVHIILDIVLILYLSFILCFIMPQRVTFVRLQVVHHSI